MAIMLMNQLPLIRKHANIVSRRFGEFINLHDFFDLRLIATYEFRAFFFSILNRLVEIESRNQRRSATQILFEEWGTSGRRRPSLNHLKDLLVKVELYRAADYVAVNLLKENAPERPATGPAALIDISLPPDFEEMKQIQELLTDMSYPKSGLSQIDTCASLVNNNKDFYEKRSNNRMKLDELSEGQTIGEHEEDQLSQYLTSQQQELSDLMKFSALSNSNNVFNHNGFVGNEADENNQFDQSADSMPNFSDIFGLRSTGDVNIPELSSLKSQPARAINLKNDESDNSIGDPFQMNLNLDIANSSMAFSVNIPDCSALNSYSLSSSTEQEHSSISFPDIST